RFGSLAARELEGERARPLGPGTGDLRAVLADGPLVARRDRGELEREHPVLVADLVDLDPLRALIEAVERRGVGAVLVPREVDGEMKRLPLDVQGAEPVPFDGRRGAGLGGLGWGGRGGGSRARRAVCD